MKFEVKCKKRIRKTILNISLLVTFIIICLYIPTAAASRTDLFGIIVFDLISIIVVGYVLIFKGQAEVVNSLTINGSSITIKRFLSPIREINVSNIIKYSIGEKRMYRGGNREYVHLYYDDTFIELYKDNVCNFDSLVDYLHEECGTVKEFNY